MKIRSVLHWNEPDIVLKMYPVLKNYTPEIKYLNEGKTQSILTIAVENVTDITHICEKNNLDIIIEPLIVEGGNCSLLICDDYIE